MQVENVISILNALTEKRFALSECGRRLTATGKERQLYTITIKRGRYEIGYTTRFGKLQIDTEYTVCAVARRINWLETGKPLIENDWMFQ